MEFRLAREGDLNDIMEIIRQAQAFLRASGVDQWQVDGYPAQIHFEEDIKGGFCHVLTVDENIAAVVTINDIPEKVFDGIKGGKWLTEGTIYAVIHRSTVGEKYRNRGFSSKIISYSEEKALQLGCASVRVDTHRDNVPMRRTLEKNGYVYCGTVNWDVPESPRFERLAYEKIL